MANTIESSETYAETTFKKVDLRHKTVRGAVFSDCKFVRCDFSESELHDCRFLSCHFDDCAMKMMTVKDSTFSRAHFVQCNLLGVDWTVGNWADMASKKTTMTFETCVLQYGIFFGLKLPKIKLKDCNAHEVNFSEADLTGGDFTGTDLTGATFLRTNLTDANFAEAKNYTLSLKDNTTKGAKFSFPEAMRLLYAMDIVIVDEDGSLSNSK
jgi:fluoroquinolone resistance protein